MVECVRCQKEIGEGKFCVACQRWIKDQGDALSNEITAWMAKWLAWERWCREHDQDPL